MILAETKNLARQAAALVEIEYEPLDAIFTIHQAIEKGSFFPWVENLQRGEFDSNTFVIEEGSTDHVIEGQVEIGGQEHLYLETNGCLIVPKHEDNEYEVYASTQHFFGIQAEVAKVLGVPQNRVVGKVKRVGGGFGGKESTSIRLAMAAAVCAQKVKRPVRCVMERDVDMVNTGKRHPFYARYKIRVSKEGLFKAYECELIENAGWSYDYSPFVMGQAVYRGLDNVYFFPNFKATGRLVKTNIYSNTA